MKDNSKFLPVPKVSEAYEKHCKWIDEQLRIHGVSIFLGSGYYSGKENDDER